ncbi:MAG: hypothetical protein V1728_06080 [Candidatus Micrarchaeota archaeon]
MASARQKPDNALLWASLFVTLVSLIALAQAFGLFQSSLPLTQLALMSAALTLVLASSRKQ